MSQLGEHERRLLDQKDAVLRNEHSREVMKIWTRRLPHIVMVLGFVTAGVTIGYVVYLRATTDPCARCLDNANDTWDCETIDKDCVRARSAELDQCFTLCGDQP